MASKMMLTALALFALIAAASARPRFIAVPIEDVRFIDTPYGRQMVFAPQPMEQHRISRRAAPGADQEPVPAADTSYGRGAASSYAGNDYVDYGAYTGSYGAFGWYTDHPVGGGYGHAAY